MFHSLVSLVDQTRLMKCPCVSRHQRDGFAHLVSTPKRFEISKKVTNPTPHNKTDTPQYGVGLSDEPILTPARVARSARVAKKYLATLDFQVFW